MVVNPENLGLDNRHMNLITNYHFDMTNKT